MSECCHKKFLSVQDLNEDISQWNTQNMAILRAMSPSMYHIQSIDKFPRVSIVLRKFVTIIYLFWDPNSVPYMGRIIMHRDHPNAMVDLDKPANPVPRIYIRSN